MRACLLFLLLGLPACSWPPCYSEPEGTPPNCILHTEKSLDEIWQAIEDAFLRSSLTILAMDRAEGHAYAERRLPPHEAGPAWVDFGDLGEEEASSLLSSRIVINPLNTRWERNRAMVGCRVLVKQRDAGLDVIAKTEWRAEITCFYQPDFFSDDEEEQTYNLHGLSTSRFERNVLEAIARKLGESSESIVVVGGPRPRRARS